MSRTIVVDHPLVQDKLSRMRDKATPSADFRRLLEEISLLLTFELTRGLKTTLRPIETPLEPMQAPALAGLPPALISILRAGNGLLDGVLRLIPEASVGHVGLYRDHDTHRPVQYYLRLPPDLDKRAVLVCDPMLATGYSAVAALDLLKEHGARDLRFLCLVAAPEGVAVLERAHPDVPIVTAAIDRQLNDTAYILPGLGDAGDRIYGT